MNFTVTSNIEKVKESDWNSFVNNHPKGNIFQTYDEYRLLQGIHNVDAFFIAVFNHDNKLCGVLLGRTIRELSGPLGYFSSRTVIYGGPLIDHKLEDNSLILDLMLKRLDKKVKKKCIFVQFRNFFDWGDYRKIFEKNGYQLFERLNYIIDTSSQTIVKKRISSSKLRQVKKGLSAGAQIITPENIEQVKDFYQLLFNLYKYKVKKPLVVWSFFENFYKQSKEGNLGIIKLIKFENKIIGGIVAPIFNDKVIYELYICGLDQQYKNAYPSVLATWAAIDYAVKNNIKTFDFMGVGVPDKEYGVRNFKSKFGGELVNYGRFGKINNKFHYSITEIGFNILALFRKI